MTPSKDKATQESVERLESLTASMESEDCDGIVIPGHGPLHTAALRLLLEAHKAMQPRPIAEFDYEVDESFMLFNPGWDTWNGVWQAGFWDAHEDAWVVSEAILSPSDDPLNKPTHFIPLSALPPPQDQGGDE